MHANNFFFSFFLTFFWSSLTGVLPDGKIREMDRQSSGQLGRSVGSWVCIWYRMISDT